MTRRRELGGGRVIEGVRCPTCGDLVVYNGNYFCARLADGGCTWALSHDLLGTPIGQRDRAVWRQIKAILNLEVGDE